MVILAARIGCGCPLIHEFVHWFAFGICPPSTRLPLSKGSSIRDGPNSLGESGWTGTASPLRHGVSPDVPGRKMLEIVYSRYR